MVNEFFFVVNASSRKNWNEICHLLLDSAQKWKTIFTGCSVLDLFVSNVQVEPQPCLFYLARG